MNPPFETFKGATCKGCYGLGTACGQCEKCAWERSLNSPKVPQWSSEVPKKTGYYWWRTQYDQVRGHARIVWLYQTPLPHLSMAFIGTDYVEKPGMSPGEFWSEPISGPEEPK